MRKGCNLDRFLGQLCGCVRRHRRRMSRCWRRRLRWRLFAFVRRRRLGTGPLGVRRSAGRSRTTTGPFGSASACCCRGRSVAVLCGRTRARARARTRPRTASAATRTARPAATATPRTPANETLQFMLQRARAIEHKSPHNIDTGD